MPLQEPVSDAKVHTGRQAPLAEVDVVVVEVSTTDSVTGLGFSYSKRAGGPAIFAHARQIAPLLLGEDALDIGRLWEKLVWAAASVGREGVAVQAVAAFDIALHDRLAKFAGLPLARLLGSHRDRVRCYDTAGGFLSTPAATLVANAERSRARGIAGVKVKVGGEPLSDLARVAAVRDALGEGVPLMVDANQQWDRATARRMGRRLAEYDLEWIEEPLDAYDVDGHAALRWALEAPIASGEMLTTTRDHRRLLLAQAVDVIQPDAVRVGGITPYRRIADLAHELGVLVAPHFAPELHVHLAAAQPREGWVEYFDWLRPLFNERLELRDGFVLVPDRPGLGLSLDPAAAALLVAETSLPER
ncbi:MAG: mandelate racemase/muconate lactonizing enzyme family protein [Candidatus Limnocylindria bacterium]